MPSELEREQALLVTADRDIAEGEVRVARQQHLVSDLHSRGESHGEAERLLGLMEETLSLWRAHRVLIAQRIAHLKAQN